MIDSEIVVGTGLRITVATYELAAAGARRRAASRRARRPRARRDPAARRGGRLHLAATDMELSLRASLEARSTARAGRRSGPAAARHRALLPDGEVTIEHRPEEAVVVVTSGTASYRLHTYSTEDFPRLPDVELGVSTRSTATRYRDDRPCQPQAHRVTRAARC